MYRNCELLQATGELAHPHKQRLSVAVVLCGVSPAPLRVFASAIRVACGAIVEIGGLFRSGKVPPPQLDRIIVLITEVPIPGAAAFIDYARFESVLPFCLKRRGRKG